MIHTNRTVTVGNQESIIDSPIILYRGDRDVEVEFTLNGNKFMFSNSGNVIKSTNATMGQLVINTPSGENMFSEVSECHEGKVVFVITKEMIDELIEVGFYSFQIRLFDDTQASRVTIPPVHQGIDIRTPIAAEDETDIVDVGLVGYSVVRKDEFEDLSTFLPSGDYNKTNWEDRDIISRPKLNKIEDAIFTINENMESTDLALLNRLESINQNVNRQIQEFTDEADAEIENFERTINNSVNTFKVDTNAAIATHKNEVDNIIAEHKNEVDVSLENKPNKKDLPYVDVKLYGAKGDGVTDDTAAIKNALAENSNLYFPQGTYIISESITLSKTTNIRGESTTLNWGVGTKTVLKGIHDDYIFKCSWGNQNNFYKINFSGKGIHTPCSSFIVECGFSGNIGIYHSRVTTIDRCVFANCVNGLYKAVDSKILNSFFYNNEIGMHMYDSNDNIIQGNKIEWNGIGIQFDTNVYNIVCNNIFDRQTTFGMNVLNGSFLMILNNQFERNLTNHLKINQSDCTIMGNGFYWKNSEDDQSGEMLPNNAIFIDSITRGKICNNVVRGKKMFETAYSYVSGLMVHDNYINGNSDNPKWINLGSVEVAAGATKQLRYNWSSLDFLGANGYDVYIRSYRVSVNGNAYAAMGSDLQMYMHANNGIFINITNSLGSAATYTVYALMEHKQWNKR